MSAKAKSIQVRQHESMAGFLLTIMYEVKAPLINSNYEEILYKFLDFYALTPEEFEPKDSFAYETMLETYLDRCASTLGGLTPGSSEWARVARLFYTAIPFEAFNTIINSSMGASDAKSKATKGKKRRANTQ